VALAAVEQARAALVEVVGAGSVGEHLGAEVEGERVVTHLFAATLPGYRGWRWAVTVARAARAKTVTVDESVLLPGADSLVAPEWLPWSDRVQAGDLGAGDLLPAPADDPRLVPGWTGADEGRPAPDDVRAVVEELGLGRERVLSVEGRDLAAMRWYEGDGGPATELAQQAPARCATCGFAVLLRGPLGQAFAVCANEQSPRDGAVVSWDAGCGAHSSVSEPISAGGGSLSPPVLDTLGHDPLPAGRVPSRRR
jgi:hypothetical protein